MDLYFDFGEQIYIQDLIGLKKINPNLKAIAVVVGHKKDTAKYTRVAADPKKRRNFIESAIALVQKLNFDGLDLDWEYPGTSLQDKANFDTWIKES
uniref:GH18 domain-containing protein n=1 Tax=Megaselia scalaris TaxID=36166 RepID=T1GIP7_MEGSC